jgi:tRNA-dihydrouridine synthase A
MAEPELVADCVRAIKENVKVPVTVKHRLGLNRDESYDFVLAFVEKVSAAGCRTFIVHARNAVLKGLSPKENREVPPLRYETVYRLKKDFPSLEIVLNGGLTSKEQDPNADGVMLGRAAYHQPWVIADTGNSRIQVIKEMQSYCQKHIASAASLRHVTRHMLGLYHGHPRARLWRRMLSDPARLSQNDPALLAEAREAVESGYKEIVDERGTQARQAEVG